MSGHGMSLFNAMSSLSSLAAILLSPFAVWLALPASDYYGDSVPQHLLTDHAYALHLRYTFLSC